MHLFLITPVLKYCKYCLLCVYYDDNDEIKFEFNFK